MIDLPAIERTRTALKALGAGRGPIIVGPWLSEIGFEVLYWVPWLRWAVRFAGLRAEDLYIVSRGGARSWYRDIGAHYLDVLDFYTPDELCAGGRQRIEEQQARASEMGMKHALRSAKQHMRTAFDEAILARVSAAAGLESPRVLHPSLMYGYFRPYWKRKAATLYERSTVVRRLTPPALDLALPNPYVAMKFYSSMALPDTPTHRQLVQDTVLAQAQTSDVVLLHSGTQYDDHGEFPIPAHPRVHRIDLPPTQNLDIQTAVIAGATRYVGTYGGFAYLAPFLGVPTVGLYGDHNFRKDHRDLMGAVARELRVSFDVASVDAGVRMIARRVVRRAA
jgi:hypothetical protein